MAFLESLMSMGDAILFLVNFVCIYVAVKGSFARAFGVAILVHIAVYLIGLKVVVSFTNPQPITKSIDFGTIGKLGAEEPSEALPPLGLKVILYIIGVIAIFGAMQYVIEYAIVHYFYPQANKRRLQLFVLIASLFSFSSLVLIQYVAPYYKAEKLKAAREDDKKRFIEGIERGSIQFKKEHGDLKVIFSEPFPTAYGEYKEKWYVIGLPVYLQSIAYEHVKKPKRSR